LDDESIIGRMKGKTGVNDTWFADTLFSEINGNIEDIELYQGENYIVIRTESNVEGEYGYVKKYLVKKGNHLLVQAGDKIVVGTPLIQGKFINDSFYVSCARMFLIIIYLILCTMVITANKKHKKMNPESHPKK